MLKGSDIKKREWSKIGKDIFYDKRGQMWKSSKTKVKRNNKNSPWKVSWEKQFLRIDADKLYQYSYNALSVMYLFLAGFSMLENYNVWLGCIIANNTW